MNGRSQAVRLPKEFRFEGTEVAIRRDPVTGDVVLAAASSARHARSFEKWLEKFEAIKMDEEAQLPPPPRKLTFAELTRLLDAADVPEDFMAERRTTLPRDLDLF
jgi:virulence-associated protein VagC